MTTITVTIHFKHALLCDCQFCRRRMNKLLSEAETAKLDLEVMLSEGSQLYEESLAENKMLNDRLEAIRKTLKEFKGEKTGVHLNMSMYQL